MILLHRKSIIDCTDDFNCMLHEKEIKRILNKLKSMDNLECYVVVYNEEWKRGHVYKNINFTTQYCHLKDVPALFMDGNTIGVDFFVDEGDLVMELYQGRIGELPFTKRTIAISALTSLYDEYKNHYPVDKEFIELCAQYNPRLFPYI